ncbi:MAG: bifunctional adenosylcobinamide kinase/adenosylcobinamide-phosphate guanylyltransferase [Nitrospiraceae bacterium]|nr:bifunctional adenosylcobinamide kinase/adenosylcobinamide-phosphate guanylyltransferase [Nitrospiraceae bacterium]
MNIIQQGCIFVLGGAKSGKSRFALNLCNGMGKRCIFLATAQALDQEMKARIERHQAERGDNWQTIEEPINVATAIHTYDSKDTVVLIDCLTLWLNNLFMKYGRNQDAIDQAIEDLVQRLAHIQGVAVIVSNEVGMGIVPDDSLSRRYRDTLGYLNQQIAHLARKVVFTLAGIPMVLTGQPLS